MNVDFQCEEQKLSSTMRQRVEGRLRLSLDRFAGRIDGVTVSLRETTSSHGMPEYTCRIVVNLTEQDSLLIVTATHDHARGALDLAFSRFNRSLHRRRNAGDAPSRFAFN